MSVRIVDVCAFYTPQGGGVRTYIERKLRLSIPGRREIVVVVPADEDGVIHAGPAASIVALRAPRLPVDRRYWYFDDEAALHATLDRLAPDVVEVSSPWGSPAMVGRWRGDALRTLVMHADPMAAYAYRWLGGCLPRRAIDMLCMPFWNHLRKLDARFDLTICASPSYAERLERGGLRRPVVIPMGVEPDIFSPARRDPALRAQMLAELGLPAEATLLIGAARLAGEKRWPVVISAVAEAARARPVGMMIFGDGPGRAAVARAAGRHPHIRLGGRIADRAAFATILASGDAFVHGSDSETFCMIAAEAKASGLPIIVPDDGAVRDQFVPGHGRLYPARDSAALADAIVDFIGTRAADRAAATAAAGTVPAMDAHFDQLFATYERALAEGRRAAPAAVGPAASMISLREVVCP